MGQLLDCCSSGAKKNTEARTKLVKEQDEDIAPPARSYQKEEPIVEEKKESKPA